jgi:hypothetical protein
MTSAQTATGFAKRTAAAQNPQNSLIILFIASSGMCLIYRAPVYPRKSGQGHEVKKKQ